MTAVTVVERIPTYDTGVEKVVVTATDGYTFVSEKFDTPSYCTVNAVADTADTVAVPLSSSISSRTVTVHGTGLSAKNVLLTIYK